MRRRNFLQMLGGLPAILGIGKLAGETVPEPDYTHEIHGAEVVMDSTAAQQVNVMPRFSTASHYPPYPHHTTRAAEQKTHEHWRG